MYLNMSKIASPGVMKSKVSSTWTLLLGMIKLNMVDFFLRSLSNSLV